MYASYKRSRVRFHNILSGPIPLAKHNFRITLRLCKRTMRLDKKSATIKDFRLAMNQNLHLFINQLSLESITLSLGGVKPAEKPRKGRLFLSNRNCYRAPFPNYQSYIFNLRFAHPVQSISNGSEKVGCLFFTYCYSYR